MLVLNLGDACSKTASTLSSKAHVVRNCVQEGRVSQPQGFLDSDGCKDNTSGVKGGGMRRRRKRKRAWNTKLGRDERKKTRWVTTPALREAEGLCPVFGAINYEQLWDRERSTANDIPEIPPVSVFILPPPQKKLPQKDTAVAATTTPNSGGSRSSGNTNRLLFLSVTHSPPSGS